MTAKNTELSERLHELVGVFTYKDARQIAINLGNIKGTRQGTQRPIGVSVDYEGFATLTDPQERMFRRLLIHKLLVSMAGGNRYRYCEKNIGTPLTIEVM